MRKKDLLMKQEWVKRNIVRPQLTVQLRKNREDLPVGIYEEVDEVYEARRS